MLKEVEGRLWLFAFESRNSCSEAKPFIARCQDKAHEVTRHAAEQEHLCTYFNPTEAQRGAEVYQLNFL
jgi:hypothetical protein